MTAISICKLSDSGRYLLIGNEHGQYFFAYELFPPKCCKHTCKCLLPYRLIAVLFRGYTHTTVMDCVVSDMSDGTLQVLINSENGTTHMFLVPNLQVTNVVDVVAPCQSLVSTHVHRQAGNKITVVNRFVAQNTILGFSTQNQLF